MIALPEESIISSNSKIVIPSSLIKSVKAKIKQQRTNSVVSRTIRDLQLTLIGIGQLRVMDEDGSVRFASEADIMRSDGPPSVLAIEFSEAIHMRQKNPTDFVDSKLAKAWKKLEQTVREAEAEVAMTTDDTPRDTY